MKRRSFLSVLAALLLPASADAGQSSHPGGALDKWLNKPAETIPPHPAHWPGKVMRWACVCLRHGAHWTIGAINFAAASIGQVRHHLVSVHGHNYSELSGLSKEQLGNLHDAHHEGRSFRNFLFPRTPANGVDHLRSSNCPGGNCPIPGRRR